MRFTGPLWRVTGSVVSWALFTFCFTLLLLGAITVMGLGGYCASGGPYVIETECPEAVSVTMPLSIFGGLLAVAIGVFLARGFGVPLVQWAWPILFVGLGGGFLFVGTLAMVFAGMDSGGIMFVIIGVVFVVMGLVPLVVGLRADARELFLGATDARDVAFVRAPDARRSFSSFRFRGSTLDGELVPSPANWLTSILLFLVSAGAGVWLGNLLFASFGGAPA
jgi:hypothetical protein